MSHAYAIPGLRRVTTESRAGRPLCSCAQGTTRLYAWTGCPQCRGTGGVDSPAEPSRACAHGALSEGL